MSTESLFLVNDTGVEGDNITRDGALQLDLAVFDPSSNDIKYTLKKTDAKGKVTVVGKANTVLKDADIDDAGIFTLSSLYSLTKGVKVFKDGVYSVEITQGSNTAKAGFTIDAKAPANLVVSLENNTGSSSTDEITNDGTLKLAGLEKGATLEWKLSADTEWQAVDPELITSVTDSKGKAFTTLELLDILGDEFAGKADLMFRQVDVAGNASAKNATLSVDYDRQAPELSTEVVADSAANGVPPVVVMRLVSTEQLFKLNGKKLDTTDFVLSDTKLASVSKVTESPLEDGGWAYDVSIKPVAGKNSGEVLLSLSSTASFMDKAGNIPSLAGFEPQAVWIGSDSLLVSLAKDTGTVTNDKKTSDGTLKLDGIKPTSTVEFRIKNGSESGLGAEDWLAIPEELLPAGSKAGSIDISALYNFLTGDTFLDMMDADGWKDSWEFRQVDANGNPSKVTTSLDNITYDPVVPAVVGVQMDASSILNGQAGVVQVFFSEPVQNGKKLETTAFKLSDSKLASITAVSAAKQVTDEEGITRWVYDVTVKAKTGSGEVTLMLADKVPITDVAGNKVAAFEGYPLWIGSDALVVSLVADTGKAGDRISYDGKVKLDKIRSNSTVEFRIKAGSESELGGEDWMAIPEELLAAGSTSGIVDVSALYDWLTGGSFRDMIEADGWADAWEFRQVDNDSGRTSTPTAMAFTYDPAAPEIVTAAMATDVILNSKSGVVSLYSSEPLVGLDKGDFKLSDPTLASISAVGAARQVTDENGVSRWVYDVTVTATVDQNKSGEVTLMLADKASVTDAAGNPLMFEGFPLWIGSDALVVSLVADTGKAGDRISYDGKVKFDKIRSNSTVEFRIKEGSESELGGEDWMAIPEELLAAGSTSGIVDVSALYDWLTGDSFRDMIEANGWADTWEFRQVDNDSGRISTPTAIAFTYDPTAPEIAAAGMEAGFILNGKSGVISLYSTEPLEGLDIGDFKLSDPTLASIKAISAARQVTDEEGIIRWVYDVTVMATADQNKSGEVTLMLADKASVTDVAGNPLMFEGYPLWIGADLKVGLVRDTGKAGDKITADGSLLLEGIKQGATVEFYINPGTETEQAWIAIPEGMLVIDGKSATIQLEDLYALLTNEGLRDGDMTATGWKDTWVFRQLDADGIPSKSMPSIEITYDPIATIHHVEVDMDGDFIANGETAIVHLYSAEQLEGIDKTDFMVSDAGLASVSSVGSGKALDNGGWVYDVAVKAESGDVAGEVRLMLAENASIHDVAGNALFFAGQDLLIGKPAAFSATLNYDSGVAGDAVSYAGQIKLSGIKPETIIEFRLASGSESMPDGTDWVVVPEGLLYGEGSSAKVYADDLYRFINYYWYAAIDADGWQDHWEFRQVDFDGNVIESAEPLTFTYDIKDPLLQPDDGSVGVIQNGHSAIIRFFSDEKVLGLNKQDIVLSDNSLASIEGVVESQVTGEYGVLRWAYDVTVNAALTGRGELKFSIPIGAAEDLAGNDATYIGGYNYSLWIGPNPDELIVSLIYDSGVSGDQITNNGELKFYGIKPGSMVEVRLLSGSESITEGTTWIEIPEELLYRKGTTAVASLDQLYALVDLDYWSKDADGWKDIWEFRQTADGVPYPGVVSLNVTFDDQHPRIYEAEMADNVINNGESSVMRLFSTERLPGIDKDDFWLDTSLAQITGVTETKVENGDGEESWAYDVTIMAAEAGNGEVEIGSYSGVTDVAGNYLSFYGYSFWVGSSPAEMSVSLEYDSGKPMDQVTYAGTLDISGLRANATLEFRLKEGSESLSNGSEWVAIPKEMIASKGWSASIYVGDVYGLLMEDYWNSMPPGGWQDIWEFRQVDNVGNVSEVVSTTITYDDKSPEVSVSAVDDVIQNNQVGIVRLVSSEQLIDLDKDDFWFSNPGLATVTGIEESQRVNEDGLDQWVYDVSIQAAPEGSGSLEVYLDEYDAVTDLAGNGAWPDGFANLWVGEFPASPVVSLDWDSGVEGDNITSYGRLRLSGIQPDAGIEFRLKSGSESTPEGAGWFTIPADYLIRDDYDIRDKWTVETNLDWLYELAGVDYWSLYDGDDVDGWQDVWEFRTVDAAGNPGVATTTETITLDPIAPELHVDGTTEAILQNGDIATVRFLSTEQLFNLDKDSFWLSNAELATVTGVVASHVMDDGGQEQWAYDVSIQAAPAGNGALGIYFEGSATDLAGNYARSGDPASLWIGEFPASPVVSLDWDSGVEGDNITSYGRLRLSGIQPDAGIEFRLKSGSESTPEGAGWFTIPADYLIRDDYDIRDKWTVETNLDWLYELAGVDYWSLYDGDDVDGWQDIWEFRTVDAEGNPGVATTTETITIDPVHPEVYVDGETNIILQNGAGTTVRFLSTEQLLELGKDDFLFSEADLATVTEVVESQTVGEEGQRQWVYTVGIQAAPAGVGALEIYLEGNATDLAGNGVWADGPALWIGELPASPVVALDWDAGVEGDNVTHYGRISLSGIQTDASLEFRLKPGSESLAEGMDWLAIPADYFVRDGWSVMTGLSDLYQLAGVDSWGIDPNGWRDLWEFRTVDAAGNPSTAATLETITFDPVAPQIYHAEVPEVIQNGTLGVVRLFSTEQLFGLDQDDFWVSDASLATVTSVTESKVVDDEGAEKWAYAVAVKAAASGSGSVELTVGGYGFTDLAGNSLGGYLDYGLWVGVA